MNEESLIPADLSALEKQIESMKPRVFDTYILPAFMVFYAVKSKGMAKLARRILFSSGIYMFFRNYSEYKKLVVSLKERFYASQSV